MSRFYQVFLWLINAHTENTERLFEATTHRVRHRCRFLPTNVRLTRSMDSWCRLTDPYLNTQHLCPSSRAFLTSVWLIFFAVWFKKKMSAGAGAFRCYSLAVRCSGRVAAALLCSRSQIPKCYFGWKKSHPRHADFFDAPNRRKCKKSYFRDKLWIFLHRSLSAP